MFIKKLRQVQNVLSNSSRKHLKRFHNIISLQEFANMNTQVLKSIRSSMCPKQKWIPDKDVTNCFKCDSRFNKLFRWKHHCRICGRIFCSPCCQFYLSGGDLGEQDKPIRTCEFCNRKFWNYIIDKDPEYYDKCKAKYGMARLQSQISDTFTQTKTSSIVQEMKRQRTEVEKMFEIKALVADFQIQIDPMPLEKLWQTAESKLSVIIQIIFKNNKIPFLFYDWVQKTCKKIVTDIPANAMITRNMDICKYIKFKTQKHEEVGVRFIVGTIVKKINVSKKMPKSFQNINILLVYGNIQVADIVGVREKSFVSFEQMIENRIKQTNKLIEKLKSMQIGMIFLEGTVDKEAQDLLFNNHIVVIPKVDVRKLTKIRISLEISKIVERLSDLDSDHKEDYVGQSKSVYTTRMRNFDNEEELGIVIQGQKPQNGMTIFLSGPQQHSLILLKYEFKQLLRIARHLILKIYKILIDQDMMMSMSPQIRSSLKNSDEANIFFSSNLQSQATIVAYLRHRYLVYKRIVFVESDYSPQAFPQITKQLVDQYIRKKHECFKIKWPTFTQICEIADESRRVYSPDDLPLGQYLLRKLLSTNKKCEQCRKPFYHHIEVFYWHHLYVKVEVQSRIVDEQNKQETSDQFGSDQMFQELSKIKEKKKILSYIECNDCRAQLSDKFTLRQEHLELSYVAFIGHIFHSTHITHLRYPRSSAKQNECQHLKKSRIFQLGSFFVRFYTDFLIQSQPFKLGPCEITSIVSQKQQRTKTQLSLMFEVNLENIVNFIMDEIKKIANSSKNPNMSQIIKNPKESFIKAASIFRSLGQNAQLTRDQYMEVLLPELIDYLSRINTMITVLLPPKNNKSFLDVWVQYANLTFLLYKILRVLNITCKHSKKDSHLLHKESFESSILRESFDINEELKEQKMLQAEIPHTLEESGLSSRHDSDKDYWKPNQLKRGSNFPSLMSSKLKSSVSTMMSRIKMSREIIDQVLKTTLTKFKYNPTYVKNIPCNSSYQSLISNALNSDSHKESIKHNVPQIQIKIMKTQFEIISTNEEINKINNILDIHLKSLESPLTKKSSQISYDIVTILFPKEFETIRSSKGITMQDFIISLVGTDIGNTIDSKINSSHTCVYSFNDLMCMKFIQEREYQNIVRLLPNYFFHIQQASMLTPIYGVFQVNRNSRSEYVIIMENMYFGMNKWITYDLKGTRWKRFSKLSNSYMDVNLLLDRNSEPLFSSTDVLLHLKKTVEFLAQSNIVDYSLTLILSVDEKEQYLDGSKIKLGIANYFGTNQDKFSKVVGLNAYGASTYADRLLKGVRRYFWAIPS